ncbi:MAG: flagellar biosynthesis protein FlhA [Bacteriovoracaceae bacterium]|nr:flagellar biosynthesis protein FlhA [Bacteriovoracaceae bacterium]
MNDFLNRFKILTHNSDLAVAIGILLILGVMIIPIHPVMLDFLLATTFCIAIIILLVSVYTKRPLDFSTFPSVLLVCTLFRLSLNVASTRSILLRAGESGTSAAGQIIRAFGEFVVEGNYVVGLIVFSILVVINFLVITKGAGRVAEVSARFTLDAMPGKQMAIDADLNAGLIDDKEAKRRRKEIAEEADFYGSMDGASKFVRGDAIAGILIVLINIIGGIIVGVMQNNMSLADAARTFTLLTVGDGLVGQIPALIISTAAGIIITRNSGEAPLGQQVGKQFKIHPKALYMTAAVALFIAAIPGLPKLPFIFVSAGLSLVAFRINKEQAKAEQAAVIEAADEKQRKQDSLEDLLNLELVELEVGYGLVHLVDSEQNGDLLERITHIRKQFVLDWGVIVPPVQIKDNLELKPGGYRFKIKGIEVAQGELMADYLLAMDPGAVVEKIDGIETTEPVFGLPAVWILPNQKEDAQYNGYTVVDQSTIIATHLTEIMKANLHEIFGRQELVNLLDNLKQTYPRVVSDLIPDILPLGVVLKVLKNLLREGVSIRDLRTILETLAENGAKIKDPDELTELVRQALYRNITENVKNEKGDIPLYTLDRSIEEAIANNIVSTDQGNQLSLDPKITHQILAGLNEKIEEATGMGEKMVVLCSPAVRPYFKHLTEKFIPNLMVIGHNELGPDANIRSLGTVRL